MRKQLTFLLYGLIYTTFVFANPADLDVTFADNGIAVTNMGIASCSGYGIAIQSDQKIVVVGSSYTGRNQDILLTRFNTNGSLDTSFGVDGAVTTDFSNHDDYGSSIVIQPDGKIVVAGISFFASRVGVLARYHTDGSLDTSFGNDGKITIDISASRVYSVALQNDAKIVISGYTSNELFVIRYNSDGSLDSSFGTDGIAITEGRFTSRGVVIQTDGKIVVTGRSEDNFLVVRYNSDGSLDSSFGTEGIVSTNFGGRSSGWSVTQQSDGKIVVVGYAEIGVYN